MNDATQTLLRSLAKGGRCPENEIVEAAIAAGADVNAKNDAGLSALQLLLIGYRPGIGNIHYYRVFDALMQAGADLDCKTAAGESVHDLARRLDDRNHSLESLDREIYRRADPILFANISLIATGWPRPGDAVTPAIRQSTLVALSGDRFNEAFYLLHIYPDAITWTGPKGATPLMQQIALQPFVRDEVLTPERLKVIRLLISRDPQIDRQDEAGRTALMYAVTTGHGSAALIPELIGAGANPHLRNADGLSALALAQQPAYKNAARVLATAIREKKIQDQKILSEKMQQKNQARVTSRGLKKYRL